MHADRVSRCPTTLPLLGSNQDSPDPESDASPRLTGTNAQKSVEIAQIRAGSHTISPTIPHRPKPFATVRRDVWLRSLPSCQPKDSPAYQRWLAARNEAQRTAEPKVWPDRVCACGCRQTFTPRSWNTKYRPACAADRGITRIRTARATARRLREEVARLRALVVALGGAA
jgi:hypothetical protein